MTRPLTMHIGDLAAELGLNTKTIRYYEHIGLLPEPERTASGYRLYDTSDLERLQFILKAKSIGLSLEEIADILALRAQNQPPCERVLAVVDAKVAAIDAQLRTLNELRRDLVKLRDEARETKRCEGNFCSLIEEHEVARA